MRARLNPSHTGNVMALVLALGYTALIAFIAYDDLR
jgi:hypothetical protein